MCPQDHNRIISKRYLTTRDLHREWTKLQPLNRVADYLNVRRAEEDKKTVLTRMKTILHQIVTKTYICCFEEPLATVQGILWKPSDRKHTNSPTPTLSLTERTEWSSTLKTRTLSQSFTWALKCEPWVRLAQFLDYVEKERGRAIMLLLFPESLLF